MPAPQPYDRQYNFQNFQATSPASPLPGDQVDTELNSVKIALDQLLASLALIQRSDGALANASVGIDQLDETVSLGVKSPTTWVTSHNYLPLDAVFRGTVLYRCLIAHTSGSFNTDLANGKWEQIADLTPPSAVEAEDVSYDNSTSGLSATDVQAALDEIVSEMGGGNASDITNDSGVTGATVADALDFLKTYADGLLAANDAAVFKGVLDCSTSPNYPAGSAGEFYKVSVAGKIGGASGKVVEVGDSVWCAVDSSSAGNEASVGANWFVIQGNIDGAVVGPASSVSGNIATFNGTSGKTIQDSGKALPSGDVVGTSDSQTLTGKTIDKASNTLTGVAGSGANTDITSLAGATDGGNAAAGKIGEFKSNETFTNALANGTGKTVASLTLPAGDWDVHGHVFYSPAASTTMSQARTSLSLTDNTDDFAYITTIAASLSTGTGFGFPTPMRRISVSADTTVYLVAKLFFAVSTATADGHLYARRAR